MIMSKGNSTLHNSIRRLREERGWSQQDLAARSGLSRTGISAIEAGRLVPSTAAALALAEALGGRVEDLFCLAGAPGGEWAWPPTREPCRYWRALVGARSLLYPAEPLPLGAIPHDGILHDGQCRHAPHADPARTLTMACCDPAVGLLAAEYGRQTPFRLLVFPRSSRQALNLLHQGLVHVAGLHLAKSSAPGKNAEAVREQFAQPFRLLRVADWQEGVALAPGLAVSSVKQALDLRWVGREPGSGARQVLDDLLQGRPAPVFAARDHRGVAEVLRGGWADAGISLRLASEEAGLSFLSVQEEAYDLCLPEPSMEDPRLRSLVEVVRSASYRHLLGELPGYRSAATGEWGGSAGDTAAGDIRSG